MAHNTDIRKVLRDATLGKKSQFKEKVVNLEGETFVIRQPNLRERQTLISKSKDANGELDMINFLVYSVILCTYTPDGSEKVFEDSDVEIMLGLPAGSFVEKLGNEIAELMSVGDENEVKN